MADDTPEQLDLATQPAPNTSGLWLPTEKSYNPDHDREKKRGTIALSLVIMLGFIVWFSLVYVSVSDKVDNLKIVLEIILSPITGLVGAVTGFYFGEKSSARPPR